MAEPFTRLKAELRLQLENFLKIEGIEKASFFGSQAYVKNGYWVLAYFEDKKKTSPWNGFLIPSAKEHHASLLKELKELQPHPILGKWLYLHRDKAGALATLKKILKLIELDDGRIGVVRGGKHLKEKTPQTPVQQARNLGPKSAEILAHIGVKTISDLNAWGHEKILQRLWDYAPEYCNLNMARALLGAIENYDWREIPKSEMATLRMLLKDIKK